MFTYIYRFLFLIVACIYMYIFKFIVDILINTCILISYGLSSHHLHAGKVRYLEYKERLTRSGVEKEEWMKEHFQYRFDGIKGFPDWNILHPFVFCLLDFRGDCDDFAKMSWFMFDDVKMYVILPYNLRNIMMMHVVGVSKVREKIYSSGVIREISFSKYIEKYEVNAGKCLVLRYL